MYATDMGLSEDPATGSAASAAAGLLAASRQHAKGPLRWVIEQGVEMGRPSELRVALDTDGAAASAVLVSGDAALVGEGDRKGGGWGTGVHVRVECGGGGLDKKK